jgi:prophage antirepressor-like protein
MEEQDKLIVFQEKRIRHIWYNNEWWFSVIDVIAVLTDSNDPKQYWKKLNQRDPELKGGVQIVPLLLATEGRNHSSNGWLKSGMNVCKKLKTQNWLRNAHEVITKN